MAETTDNIAHFRCDPAPGEPEYREPEYYEWQITDGWLVFDIQAAPGPDFYVSHWAVDREFVVQARARTDTAVGPWSEQSDPVSIVPVPEPGGVALLLGVVGLWGLLMWQRWRAERKGG